MGVQTFLSSNFLDLFTKKKLNVYKNNSNTFYSSVHQILKILLLEFRPTLDDN